MLDSNLVAAVWGIAALYGVVVALLIPRTDQIYQAYIEAGTDVSHQRARIWARTTRLIPVIALLTVMGLSLVAIFGKNGVSITWPPSTSLWVILAGVISMLIFIGIVFVLVRRVPPFELPIIGCENAGRLSSVDQFRKEAKIYIVNESAAAVQYVWIDRKGKPADTLHARLNPGGKPVILNTYAGHLWMFQDSENKCIGLYRAREEPGGVIIR
jgi:hypothetical protein